MLVRRGTTHYKRYENAVDSLVQGADTIQIPPISITNFENEGIAVKVWATALPTQAIFDDATAEFQNGIQFFREVCGEWPKLNEMAKKAQPPFHYQYDYGGGSVRLGSADFCGNIELIVIT